MTSWFFSIGSAALVSVVALVGILALSVAPARVRRGSRYLVALAIGGLLGDAFLHLIPESLDRHHGGSTAPLLLLAGLLGSSSPSVPR